MIKVKIERNEDTERLTQVFLRREYLKNKTVGRLSFSKANKIFNFCTLEKPYKNNEKMVSCIPEGEFKASRYFSEKFGNTFSVDVINRSGILLHSANFVSQLHGCIALGEFYDFDQKEGLSLRNSKKAIADFVENFKISSGFILNISEYYDTSKS